MNRCIPLTICLSFLVVACDRDSNAESRSQAQPARSAKTERLAAASGERAGRGRTEVGNRYAEKHWPEDGEPENGWTDEFKAAATPAAQAAVIERKQSSGPESLAPLIRMALRDSDEEVRIEAVKTIASFAGVSGTLAGPPERGRTIGAAPGRRVGPIPARPDDERVKPDPQPKPSDDGAAESDPASLAREAVDLVVGAAHDPSAEVRVLAMEAALELRPAAQVEIFKQTIAVPDDGVRRMTVTELGRIRSKPAFEVLMSGLQHPEPEFREQVNTEIDLLVHRKFASYDEARQWWDGSASRFSDNMLEISRDR